MKLVFFVLVFFLSFSCSHHHEGKGHHHHSKKTNDGELTCSKCSSSSAIMYEKQCAHSVMSGDTHVAGKDEFMLEHGGKSYYFSTAEKMKLFEVDIVENSRKADMSWESGRR